MNVGRETRGQKVKWIKGFFVVLCFLNEHLNNCNVDVELRLKVNTRHTLLFQTSQCGSLIRLDA